MGLTALQTKTQEIGGQGLAGEYSDYQAGEYRGATSAARFSDPRTEFAALQTGCGVYDLGFRSLLSITGGDRVRWLNGMVTNNIRDLAPGHGVYAFLLNPQGHIVGDLYAYQRGDSISIATDRNQADKILAAFDHYIIMDDVEVANLSEQFTVLGLTGPQARWVLKSAGILIPEMQPLQIAEATCECNCDCVKCTVVRIDERTDVRSDDPAGESYELWLAPSEVKKTWDALLAQGATPVGFEALEMRRIAAGVPLYGVDIRERDLPQETEQMRALNFNKGCYIGQEIVERIRSRGAVHRKFAGFVVEDAGPVAAGAKISAAGKDVGEITSVSSLPFGDREKTVALGYIRREAGVPGREVEIGGVRARVSELPFPLAASAHENRIAEQRPA